jgi:hypothetical protein
MLNRGSTMTNVGGGHAVRRAGDSSCRRAAWALFASLSCLYLMLARGRITSVDEWHVYGTTESVAESGSMRLRVPGLDRQYSRYSVLPSLWGVPFYFVGDFMAGRDGPASATHDAPRASSFDPPIDVRQTAVCLSTAFVTAATAVVLFVGLVRLGIRMTAALATAGVFAVGTLALPYSSSLYGQPMTALALLCVVMASLVGAPARAALSFAFLLGVRLELVVLLPLFVLHARRFHQRPRRQIQWLCAGGVAGIGFNVLVNWLRGDHWLLGDYGDEGFTTPLWIGLTGLLVAPGKGLMWFAPAALLGVASLPRLMRTCAGTGFLVAGVTATLSVLAACWWTWHGGWSWGPRLLVPIMPLAVMPLAWVFHDWAGEPPGRRVAVVVVVATSVVIQLVGAFADPTGDRSAIWPIVGGNENEAIYVPQTGPWGVETEARCDLLVCRAWRSFPAHRAWLAAVWASLALGCFAGSWWTIRVVCLDIADILGIVPRATPVQFLCLVGMLLMAASPNVLIRLATPRGDQRFASPDVQVPGQFHSLAGDATLHRLAGSLYVPLKGEFTFYQHGPHGPLASQFVLDGQPLITSHNGRVGMRVISLDTGFHRFDVRSDSPGRFGMLYWTTPGNARYKELVPREYLTSRDASTRERLAIAVTRWRWLVWAAIVAALLTAFVDGPGRREA